MTCYVTNIVPLKTRDHLVTRWEVLLRKPEDQLATVIATTIRPWVASRLERAQIQKTVLDVTLTLSKYGHEVAAIQVPERVA